MGGGQARRRRTRAPRRRHRRAVGSRRGRDPGRRRSAVVTFLKVQDLDASYGPVQLLFGLDLEIEQGEIVALLGTNGAGKSTLFKCVTGLLPVQRGSITFDGTDITNKATNDIAADGVV